MSIYHIARKPILRITVLYTEGNSYIYYQRKSNILTIFNKQGRYILIDVYSIRCDRGLKNMIYIYTTVLKFIKNDVNERDIDTILLEIICHILALFTT